MGSGYAADEHDAIGLPLPPVAERLDRLEEAVAALRDLLRGEAVTTHGPSLPLVRPPGVAGADARPSRSSSAAGAIGSWRSPRATPTSSASPGSRCGDRAPASPTSAPRASTSDGSTCAPWRAIEPSDLRGQALVQQVTISDDREAAAAALVEQWAGDGAAISVDEVLDCPFLLLGTPSEIAAQLRDGALDGASRPGRPSAGAPTTRLSTRRRRSPPSWRGRRRADLASWAHVALRCPDGSCPRPAGRARHRRGAAVGRSGPALPHRVRGDAARAAHDARAPGRRRRHPRGAAPRGAPGRRAPRRVRAPLVGRDRRPDRDRRGAGRPA